MNETIRALVCNATHARAVSGATRIQSLWSGYGELSRVHVEGGDAPSVVVKWAKPPHEVARSSVTSDERKRRSHEVETRFYRDHASRCGPGSVVPRLLAHHEGDNEWILVLEDLDARGFAERTWSPQGSALEACLAWLASFHATFLHAAPKGLWEVGTYWHLATRRDELARMTDMRLKSAAATLDRALSSARYRTFVHGDAKPANFCFTPAKGRVAAVDFQYVGGGVGVKDLAYLLDDVDSRAEAHALDTYFMKLRAIVGAEGEALEHEWRALYPLAKDDFRRFLDGWRR